MMIPIPTHQEDELVPIFKGQIDHARIKELLDLAPWMCPNCNLKNFGGNLACANYKCKVPRPSTYVERRR